MVDEVSKSNNESAWPASTISRDVRPAWFGPSILLLLVVAICASCLPITDIRLYDETSYLQGGLNLFKTAPDLETGPLYVVWYWLLGLIIHDHVHLYYISWCVLIALCLALPYALERSRATVIYACMACLLPFYIVWPYMNFFASAIILTPLAILESKREQSYVDLSAVLLLTCCVVALVRPEFHDASYFALAFLVGAIAIERRVSPHLAIVVVSVAAFLVTEYLFTKFAGTRSGVAFAAYDEWIRYKQGRLQEVPQTPWSNAYQLYGVNDDATVLDFLRANPAEFRSHILFNVTRIQSLALLALGVFTAAVTCIRFVEPGSIAIKIPFKRLIPLALLYLPAIAAIIIVYPKEHYFVVPYLVSIFYVARSDVATRFLASNKAVALLAAVALVSMLANFVIGGRGQQSDYRVVDVIKCVTGLQSAKGIDQGPVLEAMGGLSTYLEGNTHWVPNYGIANGEPLKDFIARISPVIIVADQEFYRYFVQNGNLPASNTRDDVVSLIHSAGYEDYKCSGSAPDVFFAKERPLH
jgi:hypothetical protein